MADLLGAVLADRFEVRELVGQGGMGAVYRADDRQSGGSVAIKVMLGLADAKRFAREASLLARLEHPAVVRHVASGSTPEGDPFLAMQWLEGEELAARLARGSLPIAETIALARRLAEALRTVHAMGIVHRDLKPQNIFLVGGEPSAATVVDFGIARTTQDTLVTRTGMVVGTVGYMAPEQARGSTNLDGRADLFSLGCVLWECLLGVAPFVGPGPVAVLAKLLLEKPASPRDIAPAVPAGLSALVDDLLERDVERRIGDAAEVLRRLDGVEAQEGPRGFAERAPATPTVRTAEQRVATMILASEPPDPQGRDTVLGSLAEDEVRRLRDLARTFGGALTALASGAFVVAIEEGAGSAERASRAALCALELREQVPDRAWALASGRTSSEERAAVSVALDLGAELLTQAEARPGRIAVDELSAGLLANRFEVREEAAGWTLVGELDRGQPRDRRLMGRPTACVGRRKELALLEAMWEEAADEEVARVALLLGPAGIGKSRVVAELRRRVSPPREIGGAATPLTVDSSGALLGGMLRRAAELREGAEPARARESLRRYLEALGVEDGDRSVRLLGGLLGLPAEPAVDGAPDAEDPRTRRLWLGRAVREWLDREASARPVLVVIDDLHWADGASVELLEEAFAALADRPLMAVVSARAEVLERFPRPWAGAGAQTLRLGGLTARAAATLVREALPGVDAATVDAVVERAQGNAFFLEELVRAVAAGRSELPATVLAVAQERVERVAPEGRRALRAASVFGESFWAGGVTQLLGTSDEPRVTALLDSLVADELLTSEPVSRYEGEREYRFRHALLCDAAYAMLPDSERAGPHGTVARWLERAGETSAALLAEHWDRAGRRDEAVRWLREAAEVALAQGDFAGVLKPVERGRELASEPAERTHFDFLEVSAAAARRDHERVIELGFDCLRELPPRSPSWWSTLAFVCYAGTSTSRFDVIEGVRRQLGDPSDVTEPSRAAALALTAFAQVMRNAVGSEEGRPYDEALARMRERASEGDAAVRGWTEGAEALRVIFAEQDITGGSAGYMRSHALLCAAGDWLGASLIGGFLTYNAAMIGQDGPAREAAELTERLQVEHGVGIGLPYAALGRAIVEARERADAVDPLLAATEGLDDLVYRTQVLTAAADAAILRGELEKLEELERRLEEVASVNAAAVMAAAVRCVLALASDDAPGAAKHLARARELATTGGVPHSTTPLLLRWLAIRVPHAAGDAQAANEEAEAALARVDWLASRLEPEQRETFLAQACFVPEIRAEARAVLGRG